MDEDIGYVAGQALMILQEDGLEGTLKAISKSNAFVTCVHDDWGTYVIIDFTREMEFEDLEKYEALSKLLYDKLTLCDSYDC